MSYTVQQITALTDTRISVLLSDDVAYDVDRGAFEEWLTEGKGTVTISATFTDPTTNTIDERTEQASLSEYWHCFMGASLHCIHINQYIESSKSTQLDIDVVRAWSDCYQTIDENMNLIDGLVMQTFVKAYGTAIKNQITYQNQ